MKMIHFQISVLRNKQLKSTTIYRKSFFFEAKCVGCSHRIDDPCNVNPRPVIYSRTAVGVRKPPEVFQLRHVILEAQGRKYDFLSFTVLLSCKIIKMLKNS